MCPAENWLPWGLGVSPCELVTSLLLLSWELNSLWQTMAEILPKALHLKKANFFF